MPAKSAPTPGFKTPLLSPHRPPALDVTDGENKRKNSVDQSKQSPRVSEASAGAGVRTPRTPLRDGSPSNDQPPAPRSLLGKIASAAKALTPSGKLAKQQAIRDAQHDHAVEVLKPLIGLLIQLAQPTVSNKVGKEAAEALQTTPGQRPESRFKRAAVRWGETSIAKKEKDAEIARQAAGLQSTAAGDLVRLVTTSLVGVIPKDLEEIDASGIGANPYFDAGGKHLMRTYRGPQFYSGPRKAYHFDFFLGVAKSAVAEMEQQGRPVAQAAEAIERILDELPAKLHGGEIWALLTIISKAVRHEADSVGEAGSVADADPVAKNLFGSYAESGPSLDEVEPVLAGQPQSSESLLQDFDQQVDAIEIAVLNAVPGHRPTEQRVANMLRELDDVYAEIVRAFPDENSPQRLARKVKCIGLVAHLQATKWQNAPEELYGDFHTPLALELFAAQVQAIQQEAAAARDSDALAKVAGMVIALAPVHAGIDKRTRNSKVPAQRELLGHLCQQVATAVSNMDRMLNWASLPNSNDFHKAMTAMRIGFRRPVARVEPAERASEAASVAVPLNVPTAISDAARAVEVPSGTPQEPVVQVPPVPQDRDFAERARATVIQNNDPVIRVDGIDWSTLNFDDEPGDDDIAG